MTILELMDDLYNDVFVKRTQLNINHVKKFHGILRVYGAPMRYEQQIEIVNNLVESYKTGRVGISPDIYLEETPKRSKGSTRSDNLRAALFRNRPKQTSFKGFRFDNEDMITYGMLCIRALMQIEVNAGTPKTKFPTAGFNPNKV